MIWEQNLSADDVREVFSYLDSQEIVERAIKDAKEEKEQAFPDTGDSEVHSEAYKAGYNASRPCIRKCILSIRLSICQWPQNQAA